MMGMRLYTIPQVKYIGHRYNILMVDLIDTNFIRTLEKEFYQALQEPQNKLTTGAITMKEYLEYESKEKEKIHHKLTERGLSPSTIATIMDRVLGP